jgi:hypothetical protein
MKASLFCPLGGTMSSRVKGRFYAFTWCWKPHFEKCPVRVCVCVCLFDNVSLSQTFRILLLHAFCLIKERTVYILRYWTATLLCVCLKALICVSDPGDEFSRIMPLLATDCCADVVDRVCVDARVLSDGRRKSKPTRGLDGWSGSTNGGTIVRSCSCQFCGTVPIHCSASTPAGVPNHFPPSCHARHLGINLGQHRRKGSSITDSVGLEE